MVIRRVPQSGVPEAPGLLADSAPFREPSLVHSCFGRLRAHLPHWSGTDGDQLVAAIALLPGVTRAEANPLTGNVLILFEAQQTTAPALLAALPALRLDLPATPPLLSDASNGPHALAEQIGRQPFEPHPVGLVAYKTGTGRVVYKALGWSSVGMAVVGAIMPGIPTAPFVILAGYFFTRSSPEAHEWLRQSRWFGPFLRDWEEHRGVRRWARNTALGLIGGSMVITALMDLSLPLKTTILTFQAVGMAIVLKLRVIAADLPAPGGLAFDGERGA
jgi:uncharacterized membrane protein YbaN (DUF454 family)